MAVYFIASNPAGSSQVESTIRQKIPDLITVRNIKEVPANQSEEPVYVLFVAPRQDVSFIDRVTAIVSTAKWNLFFILIGEDISASDYKKLARTGNADWVSTGGVPNEITDIITRHRRSSTAHAGDSASQPTVITFVPSAGGVGNSTLLAEVGVGLKLSKATKDRRVCVVDLDFQTSHICQYLDIEPRLQIDDILDKPDRLDGHLFEIFKSQHSSGLHVFAAPRKRSSFADINVAVLDRLFNLMSAAYDIILIDLPTHWFPWTLDIVANSDGVVITGINTIPCLHQMGETLAAVRSARADPDPIAIVVNRCERRLFGGIVHRKHVERVLAGETVFYVQNDVAGMTESVNAGTPVTLRQGSRRLLKELAEVADFCAGVKSKRSMAETGVARR
jgi:pilus assembly protein CpaE